MLELARDKSPASVRLELTDMLRLPRLGEFDLIWAINDAINYLMSVDDLVDTLVGMRRTWPQAG